MYYTYIFFRRIDCSSFQAFLFYFYCFFTAFSFRLCFFYIFAKILQKNKFITTVSKSFRCLLFTNTHHVYSGFMQIYCQGSIITVAGNDNKCIINPFMQQIHCIDYQRHISSIFTRNIVKLLLRFYR